MEHIFSERWFSDCWEKKCKHCVKYIRNTSIPIFIKVDLPIVVLPFKCIAGNAGIGGEIYLQNTLT
jgi:hypothetical protein